MVANRNQRIIDLVECGLGVVRAAEILGVSVGTVAGVMKRYRDRTPCRHGRVTNPATDGRLLRKGNKVAIAKQLRSEGKLLREIAAELGCSASNAYYLVNRPEVL